MSWPGFDGHLKRGHDEAPEEVRHGAATTVHTLKNELVHHQAYHTRDEASREIFAFIEGFYNRQRLHQSLGYLSPLDFERRISDS